jgi:hypothetical protein
VTVGFRADLPRIKEKWSLLERSNATTSPRSAGLLLTCPFCLAVWTATGLTAGLVFAPRLTRLVNAGASALAGADFLHLAYDAAKKAAR